MIPAGGKKLIFHNLLYKSKNSFLSASEERAFQFSTANFSTAIQTNLAPVHFSNGAFQNDVQFLNVGHGHCESERASSD
jgi:hypothetical protein